jgi:small conductance mechanosensitive channel
MAWQISTPVYSTVDFVSKITHLIVSYTPKLIGAAIVYLIGSVIIKWVANVLTRILHAKSIDKSLQSFLSSLVKTMLNILLLLTVFGMLGVNLTSFAAILAGLAVGVGSALNGTLGNFAGGVMMLLFKPFKVGDLIEAQGHTGLVKEQGIFNTFLLSAENKTIILANGALSTGTIVNYSTQGSLRLETLIEVNGAIELPLARDVAMKALSTIKGVLATPVPEISVVKIGEGTITLAIRMYCHAKDYDSVHGQVLEVILKAFDDGRVQYKRAGK